MLERLYWRVVRKLRKRKPVVGFLGCLSEYNHCGIQLYTESRAEHWSTNAGENPAGTKESGNNLSKRHPPKSRRRLGKQFELVERGTVSTRAPFLAFLIHQRFSNTERAPVSTSTFGDSFSAGECVDVAKSCAH